MRKVIILLVLVLAGCSQEVDEYQDTNEKYVDAITKSFPTWSQYGDESDLFEAGYATCAMLDTEGSWDSLAAAAEESIPNEMAVAIATSAIIYYCPDHLKDV